MENLVPPNPPTTGFVLSSDDMPMTRPKSPFELTMAQSLHIERLKRDIQRVSPDDIGYLQGMFVDLAQQLLIKSNVCHALMMGQKLF
jgi:hypothetical protein